MTLSKQTVEYLLDAEGSIRSALKSAAVNENTIVVSNLAKLLADIDHIKTFEEILDLMEHHKEGNP